jgi:phosphatidylserine decarboxylase
MAKVEGQVRFSISRTGSWKNLGSGGGDIEEGGKGGKEGALAGSTGASAAPERTPNELVVNIKSAAKLKGVDKSGTSDPYVIVKCGGKTFRTDVKDKELNPTWNKKFKFALDRNNMPANARLEMTVMDSNRMISTFLGMVVCDVEQTFGGDNVLQDVEKDYPLKNKKLTSETQGTLKVSAKWAFSKQAAVKKGKKKGVLSVFTTNTLSRFEDSESDSDDVSDEDDGDGGVEAEDAPVRLLISIYMGGGGGGGGAHAWPEGVLL